MGKQRRGKKPTFKFTAFSRNGKAGGIDWFRYRKHILIDKLFPACKVFKKQAKQLYGWSSKIYLMEDGAKPHTSTNNAKLYQDYKIIRLRWAPNSPELNPIEHCWREIKLQIGKRPYRPLTMPEMKVALLEEWARLPQELI